MGAHVSRKRACPAVRVSKASRRLWMGSGDWYITIRTRPPRRRSRLKRKQSARHKTLGGDPRDIDHESKGLGPGVDDLALGTFSKYPETHFSLVSEGEQSLPFLQQYKYEPLEQGQFRCFQLDPGKLEEPLRGNLRAFVYDDKVTYEAISRRWDTRECISPLYLENGALRITPDILAMLRNLRRPDKPRLLWIDSICIIQEDIHERASQVGRMDRIYSNATQTIIWLNDQDSTTSLAFSMLQTLDGVLRSAVKQHPPAHGGPGYQDLCNHSLPDNQDPRWLPLHSLLNKAWFTRTWVLQEVRLSKLPWIQSGQYGFPWQNLAYMTTYLSCIQMHQKFSYLWTPPAVHIANFCSLDLSLSQANLLRLLVVTRRSSTCEAKDRVFAILGLASDRTEMQSILRYTDSAASTFIKVATHYLLAGNYLVLSFAGDPSLRNFRKMPSWVPDWSTPLTRTMNTPLEHRRPDCVSPPPRMLSRISTDGRILTLSALKADRVKALRERFPPRARALYAMLPSLSVSHMESCRKLAHRLSTARFKKDIDEAFASTFIGPVGESMGDSSSDGHASRYFSYIDAIRNGREPEARDLEYALWLRSNRDSRNFFVTRKGRMGLGPGLMRPHDQIIRLKGSWLAYAIRRKQKGVYIFVGAAYVQEFWKEGDKFDGTFEDISIV